LLLCWCQEAFPLQYRDPKLPTITAGEPLYSHQRASSTLAEEIKEVFSTTTRPLQGVTYPAYHSMRNTGEASGEKKTTKSQLQKHKGLKP
jgi:hypothetical protein